MNVPTKATAIKLAGALFLVGVVVAAVLAYCETRFVEDHTAGVPSVCAIHDVEMHRSLAHLGYGLGLYPPEYCREAVDAAQRHFPNSVVAVPSGCVVKEAKRAWVWHCSRCVESRDAYIEANPALVSNERFESYFSVPTS